MGSRAACCCRCSPASAFLYYRRRFTTGRFQFVYGLNATILFGTDTFLSNCARVADNYDFYSVR